MVDTLNFPTCDIYLTAISTFEYLEIKCKSERREYGPFGAYDRRSRRQNNNKCVGAWGCVGFVLFAAF